MAGGLFSGNIANLQKYIQAFKAKTAQIYSEHWWQVDEAVMTIVQRENPGLFDLFYGDYEGIISNYMAPIHSIYLLFLGISKCIQYNKPTFAQHILNTLEKYFEKEENQHGEYFYSYIRQSIVCNYYTNGVLKPDVLRIINKQLVKENPNVIRILKESEHHLGFYNNRHLIVSYQ